MLIGLVFLLIANFIGGAISPMFVKLGTAEIPPFLFTFLRFSIATLVFLPFFLKNKKKISRIDFLKLSGYSLFFAANATLYAIGLKYTSIIVSQILYTLVPLIVGILAHLMLNEKFTSNKIIGAVISGIGVLLLILGSADKIQSISFGTPLGNGIILTAVFCWSLYIVLSKKLSDNNNPATNSFFSFAITAMILLPVAPFDMALNDFSFEGVSSVGLVSLIGVGTISSAIMFSLIQMGIKKTSAYISSLFFYFAPLFSAITAIPILHEKVTTNLIIAGVLITSGVFIATTLDTIKIKKTTNRI